MSMPMSRRRAAMISLGFLMETLTRAPRPTCRRGPPHAAGGRRSGEAGAVCPGHLAFARRHDLALRPARRPPPPRRRRGLDALAPHLADGRRRLSLEHPGRRRPRDDRPGRGPRTLREDARSPRRVGAGPRLLPQQVRPPDRRATQDLAPDGKAGPDLRLHGRQRLDRRLADHDPEHPTVAQGPGRRVAQADGLRPPPRCIRSGRAEEAPGPVARRLLGRRSVLRHLLRDAQHRTPDRQLHRHSPWSDPAGALLPAVPHPAGRPGRPAAGPLGGVAELPGRAGVRGALHLSGDEHRAELGREHVRGP